MEKHEFKRWWWRELRREDSCVALAIRWGGWLLILSAIIKAIIAD